MTVGYAKDMVWFMKLFLISIEKGMFGVLSGLPQQMNSLGKTADFP